MRYIRAAGIGACAGVAGGILWGILARVAMRVMALVAGRPTEISAEGTLLIILVGVFLGIPSGLVFVAIRRWLPHGLFLRACVFGLVVVSVLGYPFYVGPLRDEGILGHAYLAFFMFEGLLVLFGMAVAVVAAWLERRVPLPAQTRYASAIGVSTLAIPCGLAAAILALMSLGS